LEPISTHARAHFIPVSHASAGVSSIARRILDHLVQGASCPRPGLPRWKITPCAGQARRLHLGDKRIVRAGE
jgi:hypothetical protein